MKMITITEAKRSLGRYLKLAAAGEEIGIVSGSDIISLRKVQVAALKSDQLAGDAKKDWPVFPSFEGGPVDGALNHDKYLYSEEPAARVAEEEKPEQP